MDFSEMKDKIVTRTKRADKISEIEDAINNAISFFSLGATFMHDLVETTVSIDSTAYAQSIVIADEFTRFRRMKYIKRTGQKGYLKQADPQRVYDKLGCELTDRWYRAGNNIVFKLHALASTLEVGYYQYPAILSANDDTHWMLDIVPLMIFNKACAEIFDSIGEPTDARTHEKRAMEMFEVAKNDFEASGTPEND